VLIATISVPGLPRERAHDGVSGPVISANQKWLRKLATFGDCYRHDRLAREVLPPRIGLAESGGKDHAAKPAETTILE